MELEKQTLILKIDSDHKTSVGLKVIVQKKKGDNFWVVLHVRR